MAALTLEPGELDELARRIVREMPPPRVQIATEPPFISERDLAQRWPWIGQRALRDTRIGAGYFEIERKRIFLPDHVARGGKIAYFCRRRQGKRTVEDVEDELPARPR